MNKRVAICETHINEYANPGAMHHPGSKESAAMHGIELLEQRVAPAVLAPGVDLSLEGASDKTGPVRAGDVITYTFDYSNLGGDDAAGVEIIQEIPLGMTVDLEDPENAGWIQTGFGTYTYFLDTLGSGESGTVNFKVTLSSTTGIGGAELESFASIIDDGESGEDLNDVDNFCSITHELASSVDLRLLQTDGGGKVARGGNIIYTLTYDNAGDQDASGVYLVKYLPAFSTFNATASSVGWELQEDGSYRYYVGDLPVGSAIQTVTFAVTVDSALANTVLSFESEASIYDDGAYGEDADDADNSSTESTTLDQGIIAVGRGKGGSSIVRVFDAENPGVEVRTFLAFEAKYKGGISISVGDVNGDGFDDIITAKNSGDGEVRVWDGATGERLLSGTTLKLGKGATISAGDVNGDGNADLIVGKSKGVKIYDGLTGELAGQFKAYGGSGVKVTAADLDDDGRAEIVVAQKNKVRVFDGETHELLHKITPAGLKGSVNVTTGDVDGDGREDLILGNESNSSKAKLWVYTLGEDGSTELLKATSPFGDKARSGVGVASVDVNLDGIADILVTGRSGGGQKVKAFDGLTGEEITEFDCFEDTDKIAAVIAGSSKRSGGGGVVV